MKKTNFSNNTINKLNHPKLYENELYSLCYKNMSVMSVLNSKNSSYQLPTLRSFFPKLLAKDLVNVMPIEHPNCVKNTIKWMLKNSYIYLAERFKTKFDGIMSIHDSICKSAEFIKIYIKGI